MNKKLYIIFIFLSFISVLFSSYFQLAKIERVSDIIELQLNSILSDDFIFETGDEIAVFKKSKAENPICIGSYIFNEDYKENTKILIKAHSLSDNDLIIATNDLYESSIIFKIFKNSYNKVYSSNENLIVNFHDLKKINNKKFSLTLFVKLSQGKLKPVISSHFSGEYNEFINISFYSADNDIDIFYSINSEKIGKNSNKYEKAISNLTPNKNTSIKVRAYKENFLPSDIITYNYFLNIPEISKPNIEFPTGVYYSDVMTIIKNDDFNIETYFSLDGSIPDQLSSKKYNENELIKISESSVLRAVNTKENYIPSQVIDVPFTINKDTYFKRVPYVSFDKGINIIVTAISLNNYNIGINDEIAVFDDNLCVGLFRYNTLNDTLVNFNLTPSSQFLNNAGYSTGNKPLFKIYDASVNRVLVEGIDFKVNYSYGEPLFLDNSTIMISISDITQLVPPVTSLPDIIHHEPVKVVFSHPENGVRLYYTIDNSEPDEHSLIYIDGITIPENSEFTVKAKAYKDNFFASETKEVFIKVTGQVKSPEIFPQDLIYQEPVQITISEQTEGSIIYFTTDGSEPDSTKLVYTEPFTITENTIIKAIAYKQDWKKSNVISSDFLILDTPQNLQAHSVKDKAFLLWEAPEFNTEHVTEYEIYRKLSSGSEYFYINSVNSFTFSFTDSLLTAGIYNYLIKANYPEGKSEPSNIVNVQINQVSPPIFSPSAGFHTNPIDLNIFTVTDSANIFYTIDGSNPDKNSIPFIEQISIPFDSTLVIKAVAYRENFIKSTISTGVFTVTGKLSKPVINHENSIFFNPVEITLSDINHNAEIRYTLDGTLPTVNSPLYQEPITIYDSKTLKAACFSSNWETSDILEKEFLIVNNPHSVMISSTSDSLHITWEAPLMHSNNEYNLNNQILLGYQILAKSPSTQDFIVLNEDLITDTNYTLRDLNEGLYSIYINAVYDNNVSSSKIIDIEIFKLGSPHFSLSPGNYYETIELSLIHDNENAEIFYTLDGSIPDKTSIPYDFSSPIIISKNSTKTITMIAYYDNYLPSNIITGIYKVTDIVKNPVFSTNSTSFDDDFFLTIKSDTEGAVIYFTTNGANPDTSKVAINTFIYHNPLKIDKTITIKAIAVKNDWKTSEVVSVSFEKKSHTEEIPEPLFTTKLFNAYPNPFNLKANIPFTLEKSSIVEIEIYNLLGQKIATLVSENKSKGEHLVSWNGRDDNGREVAGGVYFCRMRSGHYSHMVKLVYVK